MKRKTIEDYVELLYLLEKEKKPVHTNDVAFKLGINPASVTEIFQKLHKEGYIKYEKYSGVTLNPKGIKIARETQKKHDTLRDFLMILGINIKIANEDACKIEHIVNKETMNRLTCFVDFVKKKKGGPRWLDHFKHYYETGEYFDCTPDNESDCPVHSKKK